MFIEFSELNVKLLLLLIFPVFKNANDAISKLYIKGRNDIFRYFRYFLSHCFAGIFLIIFKIRNKRTSLKKIQIDQTQENNKNLIIEMVNKNKRKKAIKNNIFLAVLCLIGLSCQLYRLLLNNKEYNHAKPSIEVFFYIICLASFSYFILKKKLFKHHFFSLSIISLVLVILFIITISFMEQILYSFVYYFCYSVLFSIYDVLKKKYMNVFFNTPYFMMLIIGVVNTIIFLIFDVIAYYTNPDISGVIIGFNDNINGAKDFFLFILDLIFLCIWNLGFCLTIFYYSPCHTFISEFIADIITIILETINKEDEFYSSTKNIIAFSICYFIVFCFILVFNEIIILNFWGLDYNTVKRIQQREIKDMDLVDTINLEIVSKEEDEENSEI